MKPLSRRLILQAALGSAAGAAFGAERPPVFHTGRFQFTELDPVVSMARLPLRRLDGRNAIAAPAPGMVSLVYLWATWCPLCRIELPLLESQLAEFKRRGVGVVTICTDERDPQRVSRYLASLGVAKLPVFWDPGGKRLVMPGSDGADSPFSLAAGLPITYLADRVGGVRGYLLGQANWLSPDAMALLAHFARA